MPTGGGCPMSRHHLAAEAARSGCEAAGGRRSRPGDAGRRRHPGRTNGRGPRRSRGGLPKAATSGRRDERSEESEAKLRYRRNEVTELEEEEIYLQFSLEEVKTISIFILLRTCC